MLIHSCIDVFDQTEYNPQDYNFTDNLQANGKYALGGYLQPLRLFSIFAFSSLNICAAVFSTLDIASIWEMFSFMVRWWKAGNLKLSAFVNRTITGTPQQLCQSHNDISQ